MAHSSVALAWHKFMLEIMLSLMSNIGGDYECLRTLMSLYEHLLINNKRQCGICVNEGKRTTYEQSIQMNSSYREGVESLDVGQDDPVEEK
jgi:hypothetical protein